MSHPAPAPHHVDDLALAALVSSKISHDFASKVTPLILSVDMLEDGGDALGMIKTATKEAYAMLQLYRVAYGAAGSMGARVQTSEAVTLIDAYFKGGRVSADWRIEAEDIARDELRLLLNMAIVGGLCLTRGGVLRIGVLEGGALNLMVIAEGRRADLPQNRQSLLMSGVTEDGSAVEGRDVPFLYANRLAAHLGATVQFETEPDCVYLTATL